MDFRAVASVCQSVLVGYFMAGCVKMDFTCCTSVSVAFAAGT